jgi:transposase
MEGKVDIVHSRCAGLDVHKETVVACVRLASGDKVSREVRTFGTTTSGLAGMADGDGMYARCAGSDHWRPVWNILSDGAFELVLANAAHIKNVPGPTSTMPPGSPLCWPDPVEFRSGAGDPGTTLAVADPQAVGSRADEPWVQKTLEDANIKLDCVITDILGVSGRAMIEALVAGETDPGTLAELADRRLKASRDQLREALRGRVTDHHRFLLRLHLGQIDALTAAAERVDRQVDAVIARMDTAVEAGQAPVQAMIGLLITVPGIWRRG